MKYAEQHWRSEKVNLPTPHAVRECGDNFVFAQSFGSETGWDISYKIGHYIANQLVASICESTVPPEQRIRDAFEQMPQQLLEEFPPQPFPLDANAADKWWDDYVGGTAIAGLVTEQQLYMGWIGRHEALLIRDGRLVSKTEGHVIYYLFPAESKPSDPIDSRGTILYRGINSKISPEDNHDENDSVLWNVRQGDRLIISSFELMAVQNMDAVINDAGPC
ncbi:MAG: hypothetical protein AAF787_22680 [Chloroflexota bacterium]